MNTFWGRKYPKWQKKNKRWKSVQKIVWTKNHLFGHKITVSDITTPPNRLYSRLRSYSLIFFLWNLPNSVCIFSYEHHLGRNIPPPQIKSSCKCITKNFWDQKIILLDHKISFRHHHTSKTFLFTVQRRFGHSPLIFCDIFFISECIFSYQHLLCFLFGEKFLISELKVRRFSGHYPEKQAHKPVDLSDSN